MNLRTHLSSSVFAFAALATQASADITGAEVWASIESYMTGYGYQMTATESRSGDTLSVSDVEIRFPLPDNQGSMTMTMPRMDFIDLGDGAVSVVTPDTFPMVIETKPSQGPAVTMELNYTQVDPQLIVAGDTSKAVYTYVAKSLEFSLGSFSVDEDSMPPDLMQMSMTLDNVTSVTNLTSDEMRSYTGNMSADALRYSFNVTPPAEAQGAGSAQFSGEVQSVTMNGSGAMPLFGDASNMAAMIAAGAKFDGTFTFGEGSGTFLAAAPQGETRGSTSSSGGELVMSMQSNGLTYDVQQRDMTMNMQVPQFPLPISMEMARSAFNLTMPVVPNAESDFALGFTLGDFTISDSIWGLFDPAGQLPRDPATLKLDLTGKAKLLLDVFDPDQAAQMAMGQPLGEVYSLNVNDLVVSLVGANLNGAGAFTFDNSDLVTFGGMPRPEGEINLNLTGANKLIDTLINMGLLPQEQAMGARMMMGLFAVPNGEDSLTSKIEVNEQGQVLANGQRLR